MSFFQKGYKPKDTVVATDKNKGEKRKRENKGATISLSTFLSWEKDKIIGHETIEGENKKNLVNFIWCKICRNHECAIRQQSNLKGAALDSALSMARGTNVVTKFQVCLCFYYFFPLLILFCFGSLQYTVFLDKNPFYKNRQLVSC